MVKGTRTVNGTSYRPEAAGLLAVDPGEPVSPGGSVRANVACLLVSVVVLMPAPVGVAGTRSPDEYEVKAAFSYNFARFTRWPESSFLSTTTAFGLCVLGKDPFGSKLETVIGSKEVNGRRLAIQRLHDLDDLTSCHLLFVSRSENGRLPQILERIAGAPVLTVGDTEGFSRRGGMINLVMVDGRVRFEVNAEAAQRANLDISSKLLQLAIIIPDEG